MMESFHQQSQVPPSGEAAGSRNGKRHEQSHSFAEPHDDEKRKQNAEKASTKMHKMLELCAQDMERAKVLSVCANT
jgi:hypothetical protein